MDVIEALKKRSSIRAFTPDPIPEHVVTQILDAAREAPSWSNTQPYLVAVATGALCETLRADMIAAYDGGMPEGEYPLLVEYPTPLKERRYATGFGLYEKLGIAREDKPARAVQFRKNFEFFGAPCVMFLFAHDALGVYSVLDAGLYLEALLVAATHYGVDTCAQAALASFPQVVRKHFDVPDRYKLLCGVSLGYAASDVVNSFRPKRLGIDEMLIKPRASSGGA